MSGTEVEVPVAPIAAGEERVGQLSGDRLCAKCSFNLSGQTIVREAHYGLLMVRCPECGMAAALQEYPLLGKWATRLGYVTAAAWLGFMILLVTLSAAAVWGESNDLLSKLAAPYTERIQSMWNLHAAEEQKKATAAGGAAAVTPWYYNSAQEKDWWAALDKDKVFRDVGGWRIGIAWRGLWAMVNALLLLGSFGAVMAVCAPHARLKGRLLIGLLVVSLGGAFSLTDWLSSNATWGFGGYSGYYTGTEAQGVLAPYVLPPCILACAGCYMLGLWWGRAIARRVVVVLLPPRMRGPLAYLWIADGMAFPRGMARG